MLKMEKNSEFTLTIVNIKCIIKVTEMRGMGDVQMARKKRLGLILIYLALAVVLSGCAKADASKNIIIGDANQFDGILVTNGNSLNETGDYEEKFIRDKKQVQKFIDELDGKELVEPTLEELQEKDEEHDKPGNYRMLLYNLPSAELNSEENEGYFLFFYEDGTIQVNQLGKYYFVKNPHPNLLNELKTEWNITF